METSKNTHGNQPKQSIAHRRHKKTDPQPCCRLLIVEDEMLVAESLKELLEQRGYKVIHVVPSGEEAIKMLQTADADLILMDIRLKGPLDGIQTALIIHQTIKPIPIIFLSAHLRNQFPSLHAVNPALFHYLNKPYTEEDLIATLKRFNK